MTTAVDTKLQFGTKKMTVISETVYDAKTYSLCRAEGARGAIYFVERRHNGSFHLLGRGF